VAVENPGNTGSCFCLIFKPPATENAGFLTLTPPKRSQCDIFAGPQGRRPPHADGVWSKMAYNSINQQTRGGDSWGNKAGPWGCRGFPGKRHPPSQGHCVGGGQYLLGVRPHHWREREAPRTSHPLTFPRVGSEYSSLGPIKPNA